MSGTLQDEIDSAQAEEWSDAQSAWLEYRNDFLLSGKPSQLRRRDFIQGFLAGRSS